MIITVLKQKIAVANLQALFYKAEESGKHNIKSWFLFKKDPILKLHASTPAKKKGSHETVTNSDSDDGTMSTDSDSRNSDLDRSNNDDSYMV